MREVAEDVAEVETRHRDLRDDHFQECREGGEHAELLSIETETCRRAEVSAFHDTRGDEDLRVLLVNDLQAGRALEIT